MKNYSFNFEQLDLISLFISAFDDAFVNRYDAKTRVAKEKIGVRYVNGPKQRVLLDINDKAKTLTLPVVTIEQTGISRDASRVFHKHQHFYRPKITGAPNSIATIPTPVPINMDISVSIITKFKEDLDQIISNFAVHCNPYFVVSWKVPESFGMDFIDEVRIEIEWDGNVSYEMPKDLAPDAKYRIIGNTNFTIKGWLFPSFVNPEKPIYEIYAKFVDVNLANRSYTYDDYFSLSGVPAQTETISISAYPQITNLFYSANNFVIPVTNNVTIKNEFLDSFIIQGKRFNHNNRWYLSGGPVNHNFPSVPVITAKTPIITAYQIPTELINVLNDSMVNLSLSSNTVSGGPYKFITANEAGWASSNSFFF